MILREPDPVLTAHLFAPMRAELVKVLSSLSDAEWAYRTVCAGWSVKDVALHLLGDDIGLLSRRRDGFSHTDTEFENFEELVAFINLQNDIWVRAARRMSPAVLIMLLQTTGEQVATWINSLDMHGKGAPVDWAGSGAAPQWLEVAREYTEYWMHHQHICDALDRESLKDREFFAPVLHAFVRSLPVAYKSVKAPLETLVTLEITGDAGDTWHLLRERGGWHLYAHTNLDPAAHIVVDANTAWKIFTKGVSQQNAKSAATIEGETTLAEPFFGVVAILA